MKIVTLTTSHNRRDHTLKALFSLNLQDLPKCVEINHVLVNDASTDGTVEEVRNNFPDVEIINGAGDLFWAGGMRFGWVKSIQHKNYDYLFVYNDDVILERNAIRKLIETSQIFVEEGGVIDHVVVGSFTNKDKSKTTYGGVKRSSKWHPLRFEVVDPDNSYYKLVDSLNMNGALIKVDVLNKVGFLSDYFIHSMADFEYGLRVRSNGGKVLVCSGHIGCCEENNEGNISMNNALTIIDSYKELLSVKRQPFRQRKLFYKEYAGLFWIILWLMPYMTLPFKFVFRKLIRK